MARSTYARLVPLLSIACASLLAVASAGAARALFGLVSAIALAAAALGGCGLERLIDEPGASTAAPVSSAPAEARSTDSAKGDARGERRRPDRRAPAATATANASDAAPATGGRKLPFTDEARVTEINRTLDLIEEGGPFPHKQDGSVFRNREKRLPLKASGHYREYTVKTPGAKNRGARRIVQGKDGLTYYTDDHYETFVEIDPKRHGPGRPPD